MNACLVELTAARVFRAGAASGVRAKEPAKAGEGELIDGKIAEVHSGLLHGAALLVGHSGVGIDAEHKGEENQAKAGSLRSAQVGAELLQNSVHVLHGSAVGPLERHQKLRAAVCLHVVVVHGKQLQKLLPLFKRAGKMPGKLLPRQARIGGKQRLQLSVPQVVLPLVEGKEDLLLGLEVIIDGGAGKGGRFADLLEGDLLEAHGLIQPLAGVEDLLAPGGDQLRGALDHGRSPLSIVC